MTQRNRNACTFPYCTEPKDKERDAGLCKKHTTRWIHSKAFIAAARDPAVHFAMSISPDMARALIGCRDHLCCSDGCRCDVCASLRKAGVIP